MENPDKRLKLVEVDGDVFSDELAYIKSIRADLETDIRVTEQFWEALRANDVETVSALVDQARRAGVNFGFAFQIALTEERYQLLPVLFWAMQGDDQEQATKLLVKRFQEREKVIRQTNLGPDMARRLTYSAFLMELCQDIRAGSMPTSDIVILGQLLGLRDQDLLMGSKKDACRLIRNEMTRRGFWE